MEKNIYKKDLTFELEKVHEKTSIVTLQNDILNFGILCTEKNKMIVEKRKMSYEIIDTIRIMGLQNLDNYQKLNPLDISIGSNEVTDYLLSYKKYRYRFINENLLFSSSITNETELIFLSCDWLNNAKQSLINSKLYKTLGVIYLNEIKNWDKRNKEIQKEQTLFFLILNQVPY